MFTDAPVAVRLLMASPYVAAAASEKPASLPSETFTESGASTTASSKAASNELS